MDELSIDSTTNEKTLSLKQSNDCDTKSVAKRRQSGQENKPHFTIEWRQLTYYQKRSSFFGIKRGFSSQSSLDSGRRSTDAGSEQELTNARKRILNSLDGCFKSGQLNAILGPSGAGKTTFLSALFGDKQDSAYGQTKVTWYKDSTHQQPVTLAQPKRPIRIAFLPQHDHLLHHLTVYETLMFASKIKNATRTDIISKKNFHRHNVKRVAKMLKLSDCLDTRCGKLSGGQYKRVSIGQELLSEPDVIILDEPTSGLDAMTCLTTIKTLKSIVTKHPMSIILTIHQPDIDVFNLFDQIYVIAQGGMAIYEGSPQDVVPTLAGAGLFMPSATYNPARFIVENAFIIEPESADRHRSLTVAYGAEDKENESGSSSDDDCSDDDSMACKQQGQGLIKRSVLSLTDAISGKEIPSGKRDSGRRPLLNIGIQTSDGRLITNAQLARSCDEIKRTERYNLLRRLNEIQKAKYQPDSASSQSDRLSAGSSQQPSSVNFMAPNNNNNNRSSNSNSNSNNNNNNNNIEKSSAKSDYSSAGGWSDKKIDVKNENQGGGDPLRANKLATMKATSLAQVNDLEHHGELIGEDNGSKNRSHFSLQAISAQQQEYQAAANDHESISSSSGETEFTINFGENNNTKNDNHHCMLSGTKSPSSGISSSNYSTSTTKLRRQFDKRLSAKHSCSKQTDYPIWYHAFLLTHRTWLSIIRDPVFFGIQFCMHTTIPILLALIFGSVQEEGCPRVGNFDLVDFAYSDSDNFIQETVKSIRQSVGNIGIVFFEMFVLSFAINCITALVFPLDMYVLLKEHRNGWYSLGSYFIGRTLADLPVPVVLHSMAMTILYFLTGQPLSLWRFVSIIGIVILASLVAQSVGLTIGALLMRSSQSAVLAAAGIVAPFFALSGFIVRIHTLPLVARLAANVSYLYHLLNGFIILRYGFDRCQCSSEDFEQNQAHRIPGNLHTMASIWIGTYSDEYAHTAKVAQQAHLANKSQNVDPNIDVVDKMLTAFKMANSYGHRVETCDDVLPYAMLDFNLRDQDIVWSILSLVIMLIVSRFITFGAIYYKIRSFS